ncbi:MAG TPA: hypothetical protein VGG48_16720 [Rhizomicrobium sp.]|jgi:chloramphenicol 3-O-phosphotransferase
MQLIFLHGPAASGKLTVARELSALTGIRLFHNHLVVDALLAAFDFGSAPFVALREEFWLSVFSEAASAGTSLIFTFAPERTVHPAFVARAVKAVEAAGGKVRFVSLTVSEAEQARRIGAASRQGTGKLTAPDLLARLRQEGAFDFPPIPSELEIDTGGMPPAEAARRIAVVFQLS